jgi:hypothetical protein
MPATKRRTGERRRWERLNLPIPVFVRGADEKGEEFVEFTSVLNVSAGGVLIVMRHGAVSPRAHVSVEVPAAPSPQPASVQRRFEGELIRIRAETGCCLAAIRFTRPLLESNQRKLKV